jgi:hypothetical protein
VESEIKQISRSSYAVIGPESATNFGSSRADGGAVLIDADIRRIDEVRRGAEAHRLRGS